jgi:hypothetical protein
MKPNQKAKQLFYKMYQEINGSEKNDDSYTAYKCSLIVTDEILQNINDTLQGFLDADLVAYWQQVKVELNKL